MHVTRMWTLGGTVELDDHTLESAANPMIELLVRSAAACTTAELAIGADGSTSGDPTEIALLELARSRGVAVAPEERDRGRRFVLHFDPHLKRMSTLDDDGKGVLVLHVKGAPETVLPLCSTLASGDGTTRPLTASDRTELDRVVNNDAASGLRVLAVARRTSVHMDAKSDERPALEKDLCFLGFVALLDPPRKEVAAAIERAHRAGIRVHVVTGDNGLTAAEIARRVGIGTSGSQIVTGEELDAMSESHLDELLTSGNELIFARSSPEAKLRITDALRALGEIVAVTGDGVNDAPSLRRADIGIAMGRSGTDVAREAATMVLTDDDFATIVAAIEGGRRVYANVRKFIVYIFTHAVPEVVPFLVFALSGGAIPLPLTVMQILAIDLGTDTLPALALSREPAEPGVMDRPPRSPHERIVRGAMLARSWGFLGIISAALVLGGYFLVLHQAGWHLHSPTGVGAPLHHVYEQATTIAWLGIVACQVGTAIAVRTDRASLWAVGFFTNRPLLVGIAFELAFAFAIVYVPILHPIFGTAGLSGHQLVIILPFPFVIWGADELRRWLVRARGKCATIHSGVASIPSEEHPVTPRLDDVCNG